MKPPERFRSPFSARSALALALLAGAGCASAHKNATDLKPSHGLEVALQPGHRLAPAESPVTMVVLDESGIGYRPGFSKKDSMFFRGPAKKNIFS